VVYNEAETTNNKRLRSTFCIKAIQTRSIGLFATAELVSTFHLSITRMNQRTCCGSRPGFRQKKSKAGRKACRKPAWTCRKPGLQPGLQLGRIMECGLQATDLSCVQLNSLFCCLWRNVEASCHKPFVVFSGNQHRRLLPAMCHNLRDGGRCPPATAFTTHTLLQG